jgi:hypothetical protein
MLRKICWIYLQHMAMNLVCIYKHLSQKSVFCFSWKHLILQFGTFLKSPFQMLCRVVHVITIMFKGLRKEGDYAFCTVCNFRQQCISFLLHSICLYPEYRMHVMPTWVHVRSRLSWVLRALSYAWWVFWRLFLPFGLHATHWRMRSCHFTAFNKQSKFWTTAVHISQMRCVLFRISHLLLIW